tara:strand:- start:7335 stop:7529 length:195 start_codon:yes stop_codon:yes gene_type:complete
LKNEKLYKNKKKLIKIKGKINEFNGKSILTKKAIIIKNENPYPKSDATILFIELLNKNCLTVKE